MPSDKRQLQLELFEAIPPPKTRTPPPPLPTPPTLVNADFANEAREEPTPRLLVGEDTKLTELAQKLSRQLQLPKLAKRVTVAWNPRLKTTAGRAFRNECLIELNPRLADISQAEIARTFRHELAHLVSYARAGRRRIDAHGPEWKQACADLGIPNEKRCHDLPFEGVRQKRKWAYICPVCDHVLKRVRRVKYAAACYNCCREHSGGRYDDRFRLVEKRIVSG
ncbi:MAG: SprT-like domain-containing protein [Verrucomicrobiota bacterium]